MERQGERHWRVTGMLKAARINGSGVRGGAPKRRRTKRQWSAKGFPAPRPSHAPIKEEM
jgi:hypothetical protein